MNEKLQYEAMLGLPVNTCTITYKPKRKRPKKSHEKVKEQTIDMVNANLSLDNAPKAQENFEAVNDGGIPCVDTEKENLSVDVETESANLSEDKTPTSVIRKAKKFSIKFSAITVQLAVIGVLIATILVTNALNPNSGLNSFFKSVFNDNVVNTVDSRIYTDFAPVFSEVENDLLSIDNGVATVSRSGSVYATLSGTVKSVVYNEESKKYTMEIAHSDNFISVLKGLDYVYQTDGKVYSNIPVGYTVSDDYSVCFTDGSGEIYSNYTVIDNTVVWKA